MNGPSTPPNEPDGQGGPAGASDSVDRRLRSALEPPPSAADRIARRALADRATDPKEEADDLAPVLARPLLGAAGLALAAVTLVLLFTLPGGWRPIERGETAETDIVEPGVSTEAPSGSSYSIRNHGEVIVVQALDGGPSSLRSIRTAPGRRPSPPGMRLIVHGGT